MFLANEDSPAFACTPYLDHGGARLNAPTLSDHINADVAVIGGGIAGCSLALHAAAGANVVVVEAKQVGWGASSRNGGHVAPATKLEPDEILRIYGSDRGRQVIAASRNGPQLVFDLAAQHEMDASIERSGVVTAAHTLPAFRRLERRANALHKLGYDVSLLDRNQTAKLVGNDPKFYFGSVLDMDGGTINPLAYVRGLARAGIYEGAQIFENSKVLRLREVGAPGKRRWRVETDSGSVTAEKIVLCTNGYTDDLWPGLRQSVVPVRAYQFLTTPIDIGWQSAILPTRVGLTDTRRLMSGVRKYSDGRLHFSGIGPLFGPEQTPFLATSAQRLTRMFPQLGEVQVDSWWSGWMAMNRSNSWKLHDLAPGALAVLGCNGRGVALASVLGRDIARYLLGGSGDDLMVPVSPLKRIPAYSIHRPLVRALVAYYQLRDLLDDALRPA